MQDLLIQQLEDFLGDVEFFLTEEGKVVITTPEVDLPEHFDSLLDCAQRAQEEYDDARALLGLMIKYEIDID
jgi:hypothetical protein